MSFVFDNFRPTNREDFYTILRSDYELCDGRKEGVDAFRLRLQSFRFEMTVRECKFMASHFRSLPSSACFHYINALEIGGIKFTDDAWECFTSFLSKDTTLTSLTITYSHSLRSKTMDRFSMLDKALCSNSSLVELNISDNSMLFEKPNSNGCIYMADILTHNTTLTSLTLKHNKIGVNCPGYGAFISALRDNTTIAYLDISYNSIGAGYGMFKFNSILKKNSSLTSLNLCYNHISNPESISSMADTLKKNSTLTEVSFTSTRRNEKDGLKALADMLEVNTTLCFYDFRFCDFDF